MWRNKRQRELDDAMRFGKRKKKKQPPPLPRDKRARAREKLRRNVSSCGVAVQAVFDLLMSKGMSPHEARLRVRRACQCEAKDLEKRLKWIVEDWQRYG